MQIRLGLERKYSICKIFFVCDEEFYFQIHTFYDFTNLQIIKKWKLNKM